MQKRKVIGILIGNANSSYTKALIRGIYDASKKLDVSLIFFLGSHMTNYFHDYLGDGSESKYDYQYNVVYDYANLSKVDGLIISYGSLCIFLEDTNKQHFVDRFNGIPYVLVEYSDEEKIGSSIISDNYNGMFQVVEHLVCEHNCKKILYLSGPKHNMDADERKRAFLDVIEKYHIPFSDDMMEIGDFSSGCNKQIAALLDRYPDADALVCANDDMANSAYEECAKRNLVVGQDIAITGYDDWIFAETMFPPLTTVLQNEWDIGYDSLKAILDMCDGNPPVKLISPAKLKVRSSCGCNKNTKYSFEKISSEQDLIKDEYIHSIVDELCKRALLSQSSPLAKQYLQEELYNVLKKCTQLYLSNNVDATDVHMLKDQVDEIFRGEYGRYVSPTILTEGIQCYINHLFSYEKDTKKVALLSKIAWEVQQDIHSCVYDINMKKYSQYELDTMFVPFVSQNMLSHIDDEKAFFEAPMYILNALHVKSAYLYILDAPHKHLYAEKWNCPKGIYLASYLDNGKRVSFSADERPFITGKESIEHYFEEKRARIMMTFTLFMGEMQYGALMVECDPSDVLLMHLVSLQISSALNFFYLHQQQNRVQIRLEQLVKDVNEKNKILGFISENDELTGVLNRRGFMEKAMFMIHSSTYKEVILFFADLDHLKEINDVYGHMAGDYAIKTATEILKESLEKDALIARIGGDEFVAIIPCDYGVDGDMYLRRIKNAARFVNENSDKDFYVELSVGYTSFECDPSVDFNGILSQSDKMLYKAKQNRRKSVKKN